ncbi:protein phosphatase 2C ABI1, putative [Perkinsus marinus ATCC 50983]|uniref:Protein phosphatase 2C ABI1, putative n=1 Tax=Perkinsus marinus (strain ATCC 50983 / TXsc) TaxID=423536 RepID=C5KEL0_PERM5|nr:protein phosphatase 2C ABI1, putative [Perkinsus marinus ATCC 50983]EER17148.1 protein phosphatase 2C ABI1, putative [Perkinsus marinus ATCC 50983]|mmetsp:Transcript_9636/g.9497  ORF Transcript_9636/g.9497 Transcript_9636/m.9497 type:complete len:517 (-) Transcript_9636:12-1562(-)|eukprot:XP_002785352.1 protein phosphatase 2C ABI1, putative [Perkinsus marinus ATCC 50983]
MSPSPHPASSEASSSRQQQQQQPVANSDTIDNKKRVRYICYLCRRRFPGLEQLNKHERLSDLHRSNLEKLEQSTLSRRLELRQQLQAIRRDLDALSEHQSPSWDEGATQDMDNGLKKQYKRQQLQLSMKQAEMELGVLHEKWEERRRAPTTTHIDQSGDSHNRAEQLQNLSKEADTRPTLTMDPVSLSDGGVSLWIGAETWKGNKPTQEDRFVLDMKIKTPDGDPYVHGVAVYDGHSGGACADYVVEHLGKTITQCLRAKPTEQAFVARLKQSVREAFILTDDDFLQLASNHQMPDGTTAIIGLFWADSYHRVKLLTAHVGDSRGVLGKQDGSMSMRLTEDHKPNREDEAQWISEHGGNLAEVNGIWRVFTPTAVKVGDKVLQWGLAVSRSLGDLPLKRPQAVIQAQAEVSVFDINPNEDRAVVLATDGIYDVLTDQEVISLISPLSSKPSLRPEVGARRILRRSYERLSDDNLTAVVIYMMPPGVKETLDLSAKKRPSKASDESLSSESIKRQRK